MNIKFIQKYPEKYLCICSNNNKIHLLGILLLICISRVFLQSQKSKVNYFKICSNLCYIPRTSKCICQFLWINAGNPFLLGILGTLKQVFCLLKTEFDPRETDFGLFGRKYISLQYLRVHLSAKTDLPNILSWFLALVSSHYQEGIITWRFSVQIPTQHYSLQIILNRKTRSGS